MNSLLLLVLIGLFVWFWQDSLRAREHAVDRSRQYCRNYNYQFLDDTVSLSSLRPGRDTRGNMTWLRQYHFEFSLDGYHRYNGTANLVGHTVFSIHLDHPQGQIIESQNKADSQG